MVNHIFFSFSVLEKQTKKNATENGDGEKYQKQVVAELGQAQLKLEMGLCFSLFKICRIKLNKSLVGSMQVLYKHVWWWWSEQKCLFCFCGWGEEGGSRGKMLM